jgi:uncharacterized cofD-like protein
MSMLRIVGIGGGTGLPALLRGLCDRPDVDLSAIVSVADNGGSSGRLRETFSIPAVGDLRNCLVALSRKDSPLAELFQYRFSSGDGLEGHALGNLIVAALHERTGSLRQAIDVASQFLALRGHAFAATEMPTTLCACFHDGVVVRGEWQISAAGGRIERIWLEPGNPPPSPGVLDAIGSANVIVLGPGSLFSSVLPNLLVDGVADAIRRSGAVKILVCNLMTQPGETDRFAASDHLIAIERFLGSDVIDLCVVNSATQHRRYGRLCAAGSEPVWCDSERIRDMGVVPIEADLIQQGERPVHNPDALGRLILKIAGIGVITAPRAA